MSIFNLLPGDRYDGRCAEIYITEKEFLVYHCSSCEEVFTTFAELFSHITKDHYENIKELGTSSMENVQTANKQEHDVAANNLYVKEKKLNENKDNQYLNKILSVEKVTPLLHPNKSLPQRKKFRRTAGTFKSNAIGRNLSALTRYQTSFNDKSKYVCAVCGFAFKEKYNLCGHLRRHSNQKDISCSICSKKLFTEVELCLHENRPKSERLYVCYPCERVFITSVSFTQHNRKHHSLDQLLRRFKLSSSFYQNKDFSSLSSEICTQCSHLINDKQNFKNLKEPQESNQSSRNEILMDRNEEGGNENNGYKQKQRVHIKERTDESEFFLEETFDEYELVQTLSDLECNNHV